MAPLEHQPGIPEQWLKPANEIIRTTVEKGTNIYSDEHGAYYHLGSEGFNHGFVRHAEEYVRGSVHRNGIENFWSLLKRMVRGIRIGRTVPHVPVFGRGSLSIQ